MSHATPSINFSPITYEKLENSEESGYKNKQEGKDLWHKKPNATEQYARIDTIYKNIGTMRGIASAPILPKQNKIDFLHHLLTIYFGKPEQNKVFNIVRGFGPLTPEQINARAIEEAEEKEGARCEFLNIVDKLKKINPQTLLIRAEQEAIDKAKADLEAQAKQVRRQKEAKAAEDKRQQEAKEAEDKRQQEELKRKQEQETIQKKYEEQLQKAREGKEAALKRAAELEQRAENERLQKEQEMRLKEAAQRTALVEQRKKEIAEKRLAATDDTISFAFKIEITEEKSDPDSAVASSALSDENKQLIKQNIQDILNIFLNSYKQAKNKDQQDKKKESLKTALNNILAPFVSITNISIAVIKQISGPKHNIPVELYTTAGCIGKFTIAPPSRRTTASSSRSVFNASTTPVRTNSQRLKEGDKSYQRLLSPVPGNK